MSERMIELQRAKLGLPPIGVSGNASSVANAMRSPSGAAVASNGIQMMSTSGGSGGARSGMPNAVGVAGVSGPGGTAFTARGGRQHAVPTIVARSPAAAALWTEDEQMSLFLQRLQTRDDAHPVAVSGTTVPTALSRRILQRHGVGYLDDTVAAVASASADRFLATLLQQAIACRDQRLKGADLLKEEARQRRKHQRQYLADTDDRKRRKEEHERNRTEANLASIHAAQLMKEKQQSPKASGRATPSKNASASTAASSSKSANGATSGTTGESADGKETASTSTTKKATAIKKRRKSDENGAMSNAAAVKDAAAKRKKLLEDGDVSSDDSIDEEERYYQGYYEDDDYDVGGKYNDDSDNDEEEEDDDDNMLVLRDLEQPLCAWGMNLTGKLGLGLVRIEKEELDGAAGASQGVDAAMEMMDGLEDPADAADEALGNGEAGADGDSASSPVNTSKSGRKTPSGDNNSNHNKNSTKSSNNSKKRSSSPLSGNATKKNRTNSPATNAKSRPSPLPKK